MNYEQAAERYMEVRNEIDALDRAHKEAKAELNERLRLLENWFTAKAQEDGLDSVKTPLGTAYWSTHSTATVASREELFDYCKSTGAWDLLEARASKTAVRAFIDGHGAPPPGVNFSSTRVFNFRRANTKE